MNAGSRLRKLRSMSALELRTRLAGAAYRVYERGTVRTSNGERSWRPQAVLRTPETALRRGRFLPSADDVASTKAVLECHFTEELAASLERAERILAGEFWQFGEYRRIGSDVDWHADPISGQRWPLVYHYDVPIGQPGAPGDAKDVWELNRHQFLPDLAKAWVTTGRQEYLATIERLVGSWLDDNPYALGVNWSGPLEVAYRALSWLWTCHLTEGLSRPGVREMWLAGFHDHGRFLFRHLEMYESPFNHLIGEASVLFMLGTVFEGLPEAARWEQRGRDVLESRLSEQFYGDGGSVEQATVYHHATLGFYLLAAMVARRNDVDLSQDVWRAVERGIDFSMRLTQPDGRLPALGDNDDARPLAFDARDNWDFRQFLAIGAVLFRRGDFKAAAGRFTEDAFWLLGADAIAAFDAIDSAPDGRGSALLPASGYVVLRGKADASDYVCFDCGEQAGGLRHDEVASAAHGHADALAVVAHLGGSPLLVDAGFYTYSGDRAWERHFRETAAHNTVRVNGSDQAQHLEKMSWAYAPAVMLEASHLDSPSPWAVASHDGYVRTAGVRHRRMVWLREGGCLVVYDELTGEGTNDAEVIFQLHQSADAVLEGSRARVNQRFVFAWCASADLSANVCRGAPGPDGGWVAPRLGAREPAARLTLSGSFHGTLRVLTVVTDGDRLQHQAATAEPGALIHHIIDGDRSVIVLGSAGGPIAHAGYQSDGLLAVLSEERGQVLSVEQAGGTFIEPIARTAS